jgi:hypothetical protein
MRTIHWRPWSVYKGRLRPEFPSRIVEVHDARGRAVLPWGAFDHLMTFREKVRLAETIVKAVNAEGDRPH